MDAECNIILERVSLNPELKVSHQNQVQPESKVLTYEMLFIKWEFQYTNSSFSYARRLSEDDEILSNEWNEDNNIIHKCGFYKVAWS